MKKDKHNIRPNSNLILFQNCEEVIPKQEFLKRLTTKESLIVKAGFDPTAQNLHLGHMVLLRKFRHFQQCGHHCHFLIGDFTGQIGDPSGRNATRPQLSAKQVKQFSSDYCKQIGRILDMQKVSIVYNSQWHSKMKSSQLLQLCMQSTVAQMLARDDFSERYKKKNSISLVEFLYPLLQAYDSVAMKADVELGGTDQKFNLLLGREMQIAHGQEPQCIMTLPLLVGLDGQRKMSKSFQNAIELSEDSFSIFSKIMSIADRFMPSYFLALTDYTKQEVQSLLEKPLDAKKILASDIVAQLSSIDQGVETRKQWDQQTSKASRKILRLPANTPEQNYKPSDKLFDVLLHSSVMHPCSKSALRRLFQNRAIKLGDNLTIVTDPNFLLSDNKGYGLKIGKKKYIKLICKNSRNKAT